MKKQVLLVMLFCVTVILAIIGLNTEKTMAGNWNPDFPWMETMEITGVPYSHDVSCETIVKDTWTSDIFGNMRHEVVTSTVIRSAVDCASVSTGACTPSNPC